MVGSLPPRDPSFLEPRAHRIAAVLSLTMSGLACGARSSLLDDVGSATTSPGQPDLDPDFAWYRLDETSGTVAHDSSPNHYDIPGLDGVTWGSGATFDGATVCGMTQVAPSFRTSPVTLTAWLTPAARSDEEATAHALQPYPPDALSGDVPSLGGYALGLDVWVDGLPPGVSSQAALAVETGDNATVAFHSLPGPFAPGVRHLVASVVDTASATLYVDGVPFATTTADTPPASSPTPLHLGCHNDDTGYGTKRFFKGTIRDARIYQRLLAPAEIAALYALGPAP